MAEKKTKKKQIIITSAVAAVVLATAAAIAGPQIYKNSVEENTAATPSVTAAQSSDTSTSSTDFSGEWQITTGSEAGYRVDEVLNGTDVTVTGRTSDVTGSLTIADDSQSLTAAEITVDVTTISTDSDRRDSYFRSSALDTANYQTATFKLTEAVNFESTPETNTVSKFTATGELTLNGVTKTVTFEAEVTSDGTTTQIAGSIPITFSDFNVTAPNLGFVSVEDTGYVEFQLVASK